MPETLSHQDLAQLMHQDAGREISQAFEVLNSNMSLAAGALAALIAVLGAGELFGGKGAATPVRGVPHLSSVSLIVLSSAFPFLVRFFIRSVIAYQNLIRANSLQKQAWRFLTGAQTWAAYRFFVKLYWENWRSPDTLPRLIWANLKYGFLWIFAIAAAAIAWAFVTSAGVSGRLAATGILLAGIGWEAGTMFNLRRQYFTMPSREDLDRLHVLQSMNPELTESSARVGWLGRWLRGLGSGRQPTP
jgi:hypothetical protein